MNDWKRSSRPSVRPSSGARAKADRASRWLIFFLLGLALPGQADFRVPPYVQNPTTSGVTLAWFSEGEQPGEVLLSREGGKPSAPGVAIRSEPAPAAALDYHPSEPIAGRMPVPFHHEVRIGGLEPGRSYDYVVRQGNSTFG
ncbi:MAG: fibronectin type III domain-containing protein, partial [Halioglobus sp.]|nr:fibronectin type III domain-containing protein [Halioglobus sp.]